MNHNNIINFEPEFLADLVERKVFDLRDLRFLLNAYGRDRVLFKVCEILAQRVGDHFENYTHELK